MAEELAAIRLAGDNGSDGIRRFAPSSFFWSLGWHARERREEAVAATHKKIVEGTHWALEARSGEIGECR